MNSSYIEVTLLDTDSLSNPVFKKILNSINTYLLRNKGAISDFNLVKDLVERNCNNIDDEINIQIPIPLYLGLMGTMLGIIIGVGTMVIIGVEKFLEGEGIGVLMGGVGIAMISSFTGLLFTVISNWIYKNSKLDIETNKNDFLSFIETELLPVVSTDTVSIIRTLEGNLNRFNTEFGANSKQFNSSFSGFIESVNEINTISDNFKSLLSEIRKLNLLKLSKINADLLNKISINAKELDRFNEYLKQIDSFVENALHLNETLSEQLNKTHSVELIAKTIGNNVSQNEKIISYLEGGLMEIDSRKQVISDAVISVDSQIQKSLSELMNHTQESILAIQNITIKEENLLESLLKEDRGNLDKLKLLDKINEYSNEQNRKLDVLNSSILKLIEISKKQQSPFNIEIPKPIKYLAYFFLASGAIIGTSFILYKLFSWIVLFVVFLINLF